MAFRRAFSTLGCPDLSLDAVLALARAHGYDGVEVRALDGSLDLPEILQRNHGTPAALAAKKPGLVPPVVALDASMRLIDPAPQDRNDLLALATWAESLGVRFIRVFDGGKAADAAEFARAAETLRWWRDERQRHGWQVDLMVETHDSLFTADAILRFVQALPGIKILWDSHHTWKQGGEMPLDTWRKIRAHVVHVHVKDSVSRPDDKLPYTYVPPGEGEFPATELLATLHREFDGVVSVEWERYWHPALAPLGVVLAAANRNGW